MKHGEATRILSDLCRGRLDRGTKGEVLSHVETCETCRDWLTTYDLLQAEFGGSTQPDEHPDSALLALCVGRPEELDEPDRRELADHLSRCPACRDDLETTTAAIHAAQPREGQAFPFRPPAAQSPANSLARPLVLAATVVIGVFLLAMALQWGILDKDGTRARAQAPPQSKATMGRTDAVETLSGTDLQGTQTIRAESKLAASDLAVTPGADVTLEAREVITLGDGFRVASGARLTVVARSPGVPVPHHLEEKLQ